MLIMVRSFLIALFALPLAACGAKATAHASEVAIYLPAQPMSGAAMLAADLNALDLQPEPVIAADEIISYSPATHDLVLSSAAIERIAKMKVPVNGVGFVICVDKEPLVAGAFWALYSSLSFDGLTIQVPVLGNADHVHLYSGYPSVDSALPDDPRDDPRLLKALQDAGKLR